MKNKFPESKKLYMDNPLVSIIMPAYNAQPFIDEAIESVFAQTYSNWELLIVNDGSKDNTLEIITSFKDNRIKVFSQVNKGVSAARNLALEKMKGEFFCFLDADDVMPARSISARLELFEKKSMLEFVDGQVLFMDNGLNHVLQIFKPVFRGNPILQLAQLNDNCFMGSSWMVKVKAGKKYHFREKLAHGEDLMFYFDIATGGEYDFTEEVVLFYRRGHGSAMENLPGVEKGYLTIFYEFKNSGRLDKKYLVLLKRKMALIMLKSFFKQARFIKGLKSFWLFINLK